MKKFVAWLLRGIGGAALLIWFVAALVVAVIAVCTFILACIPSILAHALVGRAKGQPFPEALKAARAEIITFPAMEP